MLANGMEAFQQTAGLQVLVCCALARVDRMDGRLEVMVGELGGARSVFLLRMLSCELESEVKRERG